MAHMHHNIATSLSPSVPIPIRLWLRPAPDQGHSATRPWTTARMRWTRVTLHPYSPHRKGKNRNSQNSSGGGGGSANGGGDDEQKSEGVLTMTIIMTITCHTVRPNLRSNFQVRPKNLFKSTVHQTLKPRRGQERIRQPIEASGPYA